MREEAGKKMVRRVPNILSSESSVGLGGNGLGGRPGMNRRQSSRMFGGVKDTLVKMQSKMKLGREKVSTER